MWLEWHYLPALVVFKMTNNTYKKTCFMPVKSAGLEPEKPLFQYGFTNKIPHFQIRPE